MRFPSRHHQTAEVKPSTLHFISCCSVPETDQEISGKIQTSLVKTLCTVSKSHLGKPHCHNTGTVYIQLRNWAWLFKTNDIVTLHFDKISNVTI